MKTGDIFLIDKEFNSDKVSVISIADTNKSQTKIILANLKEEIVKTSELKTRIISKMGASRLLNFKINDPVAIINANTKTEFGIIIAVGKKDKSRLKILIGNYIEYTKISINSRFVTYSLDALVHKSIKIKINNKRIRELDTTQNNRIHIATSLIENVLRQKAWSIIDIRDGLIYIAALNNRGRSKFGTLSINKKDNISPIVPRIKKNKILPKQGMIITIKKNIKKRGVLKGDKATILETLYITNSRVHLINSKLSIQLHKNGTHTIVLLKHIRPIRNEIQNTNKVKTAITQKNKRYTKASDAYKETLDDDFRTRIQWAIKQPTTFQNDSSLRLDD